MAATVWAMRNPSAGIREPEEVPHVRTRLPRPSCCAIRYAAAIAPHCVFSLTPRLRRLQNEILDVMAPYIAPVIGEFTDWTPLEGRETLFKEDVDREDPWQFKNILVE